MKHLDLFSGIGGFALAASRVWGAEHKIVAFCEIDDFCKKVLRKNFPDTYIHDDIKTLTSHIGAADLITAGFPCQPYSHAGQRKGAADDRALWHEALRIIQETRPPWVVAENVTGIVSMELDRVLASLEDSDYAVETYNIPACGVNAPHKRERIWIVAHTHSTANGRAETSNDQNVTRHIGTAVPAWSITNPDREWEQQPERAFGKIKRRTFNSSTLPASNTICEELQGDNNPECCSRQPETAPGWRNANEWHEVAARFCRMDDGLPAWVHLHRQQRLKALGNAIVPQVAEQIFRGIKLLT